MYLVKHENITIMSRHNRVSSSADSFELQPRASGSGERGILSSDPDFSGFSFTGNDHPHESENSSIGGESNEPTTRFPTINYDNETLQKPKEPENIVDDIEDDKKDEWSSKAWMAIQNYDSSRFKSPEKFWRRRDDITEGEAFFANMPLKVLKPEAKQNDMKNIEEKLEENPKETDDEAARTPDLEKPRGIFRKRSFLGFRLRGKQDSRVQPSNQPIEIRISEKAIEFSSKPPLHKKSLESKKNSNKGMKRLWHHAGKDRRLTRRQRMFPLHRNPITIYQRQWTPSLFHMFLDILYFCGLSPYKYKREEVSQRTRLVYAMGIIQTIIFGLFVAFATWESLGEVQYCVLAFVGNHKPAALFDIGYFLSMALVQMYLIYLLAYRQDDIAKLLHDWKFFESTHPEGVDEHESRSQKLSMQSFFLLCVIGSMPAILETVLYNGFNEWSLDEMMFGYSTDLTYTWNRWIAQTALNETEYYLSARENIGPSIYLWGTLELIMKLLHRLFVDAERNLVILIAMKTLEHVSRFGRRAQICINEMSPYVPYTEQDRQCWLLYRRTINVNKVTNNLFSPLLNLTHLSNVFILSYAMSLFIKDDTKVFEIVFVSFEIAKAMYFYLLAWKASKHNDTAMEWISNLPAHNQQFRSRRVVYSNELMRVELKDQPLGVGIGHFVINSVFLYKIGMASVSLLSLLLTSKFA